MVLMKYHESERNGVETTKEREIRELEFCKFFQLILCQGRMTYLLYIG